jgi:hypothetical protein
MLRVAHTFVDGRHTHSDVQLPIQLLIWPASPSIVMYVRAIMVYNTGKILETLKILDAHGAWL